MFRFLFPIIQFSSLELRIWVLRHIYKISIKPHKLKDELNGGIPNIVLLIMYSVMMPQNFKEIETTLQEFELLEEYIVNSFMKFHFLKRFSVTFKCTKDPVYMRRTIFTLPRNTYSVLSYPRRLCTNIPKGVRVLQKASQLLLGDFVSFTIEILSSKVCGHHIEKHPCVGFLKNSCSKNSKKFPR